MTEQTYYSLRVRTVIEETAEAKSLVFEIPPELAETFRYRPGQFLTVRIPHEGRHLLRCYSLASSPLIDDLPRVTVKRVAQGRVSNWLCDRIKAGDSIEVKPPAGHFTPKSLAGDFLLFAGGSGITPVFSIIRSALLKGGGQLCLIYANRDERSVIYRDELKALASANPTRLQVIHWLDSVQGVPSVAQLAEIARPRRAADCYICGPEAFMECTMEALRGLEIEPARIHVERFVSLPDEEDAAPAPEAGAAAQAGQIKLEVELDGNHYDLTCAGQRAAARRDAAGGSQGAQFMPPRRVRIVHVHARGRPSPSAPQPGARQRRTRRPLDPRLPGDRGHAAREGTLPD